MTIILRLQSVIGKCREGLWMAEKTLATDNSKLKTDLVVQAVFVLLVGA